MLGPYLASRLLVIAATVSGQHLIRLGVPDDTQAQVPHALLPFFRFDALWYERVWDGGYQGALSAYKAAFYPLYPLMVRGAGVVIDKHLASLLISNLAFFPALLIIYILARQYLDALPAMIAVWTVALWPWSIFYSYPYAESVELLVVSAAFLLIERGAWMRSGALAALAGASRPSGILTSLAYVGELGERLVRRQRRPPGEPVIAGLLPIALAGLLSGLGLAAFCLVLWAQAGDPFGFLHAQVYWVGPRVRNPFFPITSVTRLVTHPNIFDTEAPAFFVVVAFLGGLRWSAKHLPWRYTLWGLGFLAVSLFHGYYVRSFAAVPRHLLEWLPFYFAIAAALDTSHRRVIAVGWLVASTALLLIYAAMYGSWHFVS